MRPMSRAGTFENGLGPGARAAAKTPLADLSRSLVGVARGSLVVNLPGSPSAASESLDAILAAIPHALETLAGPFDHQGQHGGKADG